jgi:AcrR family transcriptional regulator
MGTAERREREREELRQRILEATRELMLQEGYARVTMRRIATAIEYSPTAIYHHFKDKDDVIRSLCEQDLGRLLAALQELPAPADPLERLHQLGRAYARFALAHPGHYRFMFMTPPGGHEHTKGDEDPGARAFLLLRDAVLAGLAAGLLRPIDPDVGAQVMWASLHGALALLVTYSAEQFPVVPATPELIEHVLETCTRGLIAPGVHVPARVMPTAGQEP